MKIDHQLVEQWITPNSKILDLGCGDGALLQHLSQTLNVFGYGIEVDEEMMNIAIAKGVNVIEQDLNKGLSNFADNSFDTVVMARTLQSVQAPDQLLLDMLRVGKQVIVTFPNFANWQNRIHLGLKGKMPVSESIPYEWYDTPNIHLSTLNDFEQLCTMHGIKILDSVAVVENTLSSKFESVQNNLNNYLQQRLGSKYITAKKTHILSKLYQKSNLTIDKLINKNPNLFAEIAIYRVTN